MRLDWLDGRVERKMRVAIELLIDTGRRPDEACELDYDCPAGAASMTGKTTAAARISC